MPVTRHHPLLADRRCGRSRSATVAPPFRAGLHGRSATARTGRGRRRAALDRLRHFDSREPVAPTGAQPRSCPCANPVRTLALGHPRGAESGSRVVGVHSGSCAALARPKRSPRSCDVPSCHTRRAARERLGVASDQGRAPRQHRAQSLTEGRPARPRDHRLRRHRHAAARQRVARRPRHRSSSASGVRRRRASSGRSSACSTSGCRSSPGSEINDDPYDAGLVARASPGRRPRRRHTDRVGAPRPSLRREARDTRHVDRRPDRRGRPDQGRRGPLPLRRAHDPLRARPAHEPRHLLDQRASRPRRAHPGRSAQRARGARRADPGLQDPAPARRGARSRRRTPRTTPTAGASSRR